MAPRRLALPMLLVAAAALGCSGANANEPSAADTATGTQATPESTDGPAAQQALITQPAWLEVAPCDAEGYECDEPAEAEVADPAITVQVESNGYSPASDVIVGTFNFRPDQTLDPMLYQIGADGQVKKSWRITNKHGGLLGDRRMLPNGNILFTIFKDGIYEMNPEGEIVWHYLDKGISHHAEMLPNGNVLAAGIYCDCVKEIDYENRRPAWEWHAGQAFLDYDNDSVFPGGKTFGQKSAYSTYSRVDLIKPDSWVHLNGAQLLVNGNFLVSLRNFDLVVEVDREGRIVWSFGPGILKHQHTPRVLDDGTLAVFDNGNQRAIVVDRATQAILWEAEVPEPATVMGEVNRLSDGNYKILSSLANVLRVISPSGEQLWSMTITTESPSGGIYRAHMPASEN